MKKYSVILLFLFTCGYSVKAQFLDSIQASIARGGSFSFGFNSRNSFITNHDAHIWGFLIGVRFDRKIGLGGGYNVLTSPIYKTDSISGKPVTRQLYTWFFSYYIEYLLKLTKHWEIDIFLAPGLGNSYYAAGQSLVEDQHLIMPIEPSVCVEYDFNKFLGLYVQAGYRWMLINNHNIKENFNSPVYSFGVAVYPLEIFAALFPKTKLAHIIEDN